MTEVLGKASLELEADSTKLDKDLAAAEKSAGKFGSKFAGGIKKATVPAMAVMGAAVVGFRRVTGAASDLNESINAVDVVFGKAGKQILDFGKVSAKEAGLSMRELNELVAPVGASLINAGLGADKAATASVNLARRAADMASVFGGPVSGALEAIQAGLRGEADPLERFGVGLSDAAVRAKAVELGLAKTAAEVDRTGLAQARLALIMAQTNRVQGDFAKTSGDAANAARVNTAEQENLEASIGQGLLPVLEMFQAVQKKATVVMMEHQTAVKIVAGVLTGLAATVLLVRGAMIAVTAATAIASVAFIGLGESATLADKMMRLTLIGALISLGLVLVLAWQKSETFREVVTGAFNAVRNAALTAVSLILDRVADFLEGIEAMVRAMSKLPFIGDKFKGLADKVGAAADRVRGLQANIDGLKSKTIDITVNYAINRPADAPGIGGRADGGPVKRAGWFAVGKAKAPLVALAPA